MATTRVDVISDTHGRLSPELLDQLSGADVIVHAGDICSRSDYETLRGIAECHLCLGNNDWGYDYDPSVKKVIHFYVEGLLFCVSHYREKVEGERFDVGVCGHTHSPFVKEMPEGGFLMNPGSTTFPRTAMGPTMGRVTIEDGGVADVEIVRLFPEDGTAAARDDEGRRHWWG